MEKTVGQILKAKRETRKFSLEKVHKDTRIGMKYLIALEEEKFDQFPAEVYVLGFLRSYARYLGLNENEIINHYQETYTQAGEKEAVLPKKEKIKFFGILSKYRFWFLIALLIFLITYYLSQRIIEHKKESLPPQVPAVSLPPKPETDKIVLEAKTLADTWIKIVADDVLLFEKILPAGNEKRWEAKEKIFVRVGYISGVEIKFNGQVVDLKPGSEGEVNEILLTRSKETK